jgi:hypothetical protein
MVQTPSERLKSYWPRTAADDTDVERPEVASRAPWPERLAKYMGQHPGTTLAAAALVGLVVGWMVKRK